MSFDVSPLPRVLATSPVDRASRPTGRAQETSFAIPPQSETPQIPDEVWEQVEAAARIAEDLQAQGKSVRFDVHKLDGVVVANLVDEYGLLRPLLLPDVVDVERLSQEVEKELP